MINFPNAKINIGLNITEKRSDGYHSIETIFYPIQLKDALEVLPSDRLEMKTFGLPIPGDAQNNLCLKAYDLIRADFALKPISIRLLKNIPMGAGLGGGSADAAFFIQLINDYFHLNMSKPQMVAYCNQLGSDCAFFIENKPVYAFGRGNEFETLSVALEGLKIVLVKPAVHVSTSEAYSSVRPHQPANNLKDLIALPIEQWQATIFNDFENAIFPKYPTLLKVKNDLLAMGAKYASMSGSGSTIYGIFDEYPKDLEKSFPGMQVFCC
jgi:4-diphosphocytidyl-2-C-methyl-D-erythritol kinase